MKWDERIIATAIARQTLARKCVVLVDRCSWPGNECDVLAITNNLRVIDVEIKISRSDLKADASKDKWWHRFGSYYEDGQYKQRPSTPRMWPRRVWKHYYAMPAEIWKPELEEFIHSAASGILLLTEVRPGQIGVRCHRRAKPDRDAIRLSAEQVMDVARLGNLRMWDAYETLAKLAHEINEVRGVGQK